MTDSNTSCPSPDELRLLLEESLPEPQQTILQQHLDNCEACQKALASMVAGSESWEAAVAHLKGRVESQPEPGLEEVVRRIKADELDGEEYRAKAKPLDFLQPSDQPGSIGRLGTYEVSQIVGQGGMGVVVKAFDPTLHRVVAVKVLAPYLAHNPQARRRFIREAQAIAAVCHDHVITIHAIDESEEQPKIVMQFVSGRSLQEKLDAEGALALKEILRIGMQTAAGLAAAHAQGLVHRDVKPSNILLENGIQRVKLTDFGLARAVDDASLTQSGVIAGTPQYMAPEQANGDAVDYRADLFSLGSVMYAMCVGHSPFRASTTMGVLKRVCHDAPRPIREVNSDIPDWLCAIVMKLLAKSPADRFQSAREVADLLERWLAHLQQPTIVAKPHAVEGFSPERSQRVEPANFMGKLHQYFTDGSYSNTIFFQPVSGRQFLTWYLSGAVIWFVFGLTQRMNLGEVLVMALMGGLIITFWGIFLIALARFLWSNLIALVRLLDSPQTAAGSGSSASSARLARWLTPEIAAIVAAVLSMMFGASPVEAAIIGVVVWCLGKYGIPILRRIARPAATESVSPEARPE
ncbi:MAG: serine/threonine protein kinase [Schlesneria sp.]|nr:serine/threonine protein kinase [Schlesneria sp.]